MSEEKEQQSLPNVSACEGGDEKPVNVYSLAVKAVRDTFRSRFDEHKGKLFEVEAEGLAKTYLAKMSDEHRQVATCKTCERFMESFGNLVYIKADGTTASACWDHTKVPDKYKESVKALEEAVASRPVTAIFYSAEKKGTLGVATTKTATKSFQHYHLVRADIPRNVNGLPKKYDFEVKGDELVSKQRAAHLEGVRMLSEFFEKHPLDLLQNAASVLLDDRFTSSIKHRAMADWMADNGQIYEDLEGDHVKRKNWLHGLAASAPVGYTHAVNTIYGTILKDLKAGESIDSILRTYLAFTDPLAYQRTTAAPTVGQIKRAEEVFAKMELGPALKRRHAPAAVARPHFAWTSAKVKAEMEKEKEQKEKENEKEKEKEQKQDNGPEASAAPANNESAMKGNEKEKPSGALSDALTPEESHIPEKKMTWRAFEEDVAPEATEMHLLISTRTLPYTVVIGPVEEKAPPLFRWDTEEQRNPYSWACTYAEGDLSEYGMAGLKSVEIAGVGKNPCAWFGSKMLPDYHGAQLYVEGFKVKTDVYGMCFFPECLREELREVKTVVERYSESKKLQDYEDPTQKDHGISIRVKDGMLLKVKTPKGWVKVKISGMK